MSETTLQSQAIPIDFSEELLDGFYSLRQIRIQADKLAELTFAGDGHFQYHPEQWGPLKADLFQFIKARQDKSSSPIPPHSRRNHYYFEQPEAEGPQNKTINLLQNFSSPPLGLITLSVLMDAGAGDQWSFQDGELGVVRRSEGLALAVLRAFQQGAFSASPREAPFRIDSQVLSPFTQAQLHALFQITPANPLKGADSRLRLLHKVGELCSPLNLEDKILELAGITAESSRPQTMDVNHLLKRFLKNFHPLWDSKHSLRLGEFCLGDCWHHPALGAPTNPASYVPFHKLTQWLLYSLVDLFEGQEGTEVGHASLLTPLAEYRNGGMLLDSGVIGLKSESRLERPYEVSDPQIIEWRALTVHLIDKLYQELTTEYAELEKLSLSQFLEAGTWNFGRHLASMRDPAHKSPPLPLHLTGHFF